MRPHEEHFSVGVLPRYGPTIHVGVYMMKTRRGIAALIQVIPSSASTPPWHAPQTKRTW